MLEKEIIVYNLQKALLRIKYPDGGFVVIKDQEILGVWQTRADALRAGFEKYGNIQFLVRSITENDIVANFSRNLKFT